MVQINYIVCHVCPIKRLFRPFFNCGSTFLIHSVSLFVTDLLPVLPVSMRSFCKHPVFLSLREELQPLSDLSCQAEVLFCKKFFHFQKKCSDELPTGYCTVPLLLKIKISPVYPTVILSLFRVSSCKVWSCYDQLVPSSVAVTKRPPAHSKKLLLHVSLHCGF